jgi:PAS domain S-box-containing protein
MIWPYAYTPYIWPMLAIAALLVVLGVYAWGRRNVPAATPFAFGTFCWAAWAVASALELAATDAGVKLFWFGVQVVLQLPSATLALVFVIAFAGLEKWLTRRNLVLLFLPSAIVFVMVVTNPAHHLFWSRIWIDEAVTVERGPVNWVGLVYGNLFFPLQIGVLVWLWIRSPLHRWPAALILGAQLLSRTTYIFDALHLNPFAPFDAFMLAGTLTIWAYFLALFRFRILSIVPVGRDSVIERMSDGMVLLDAENRVADINPAAQEVLALPRRETVGRPAARALAGFPELLGLLEQGTPAEAELKIEGSESRYLQVHTSPLVHPRGFNLGRLIVLQDITEQKRAREQLSEQQRALATLQERERLGRELHDSLGQVLGYLKLKLHLAREALAEEEKTSVDRHLAQLEAVVQEAHTDVRDYLLGLDPKGAAETGFLSSLRDYLSRFGKTYQIETDLQVSPEISDRALDPTAQVQLRRIIQEALTNTRKHAGARRACVSLQASDGRARIIVEDDGGGFDKWQAVEGTGQHYGLGFMRERAAEVGGSVEIDSAPDRGTRVVVEMPLQG